MKLIRNIRNSEKLFQGRPFWARFSSYRELYDHMLQFVTVPIYCLEQVIKSIFLLKFFAQIGHEI